MASVSSSVEVMLTKEEKELLEKAIAKIEDIYEEVIDANSSLFIDESDIFSTLLSISRRYGGKLSNVIEIEE
jgi:Flp pilus assembly protein TadB